MNRVQIHGLKSTEYEHPLDKATLDMLKKTPLLPELLDLVLIPLNSITRLDLMGNNVLVTEKQFSSLHRLMREACEVLEVAEPLFYVSSHPEMNAYTSCPDKPIVCIHGYLLDILNDEELLFIIGHELSHIKSQHIIYQVLGQLIMTGALGAILTTVPGFGIAAETALRYAYFMWARASEFSCDRGGYLACQNFEASCSALMKLAGSNRRHVNELSVEAFIEQGKAFKDIDASDLGKVQKIILSYEMTHPWPVARVSELIKFNESGQYYNVLHRKTKPKEQEINVCKECGKISQGSAKFCRWCGHPY